MTGFHTSPHWMGLQLMQLWATAWSMHRTAKAPRDARSALTSLVREAVSTVGNARADGDFLEAIARLQKHGVDVGDKYCSQKFLQMHDGNGKC